MLQARHGVPIDVELPTLAPADLVVLRGPDGDLFPHPAVEEIRFTYRASTGVDGALAALVTAWEAAGGPGSPYRVRRVGDVRQLVPTTSRDPDGHVAPWTSPLDCTLRLDAQVGHPLDPADRWLEEWATAMEEQCGVTFDDVPGLPVDPPPPPAVAPRSGEWLRGILEPPPPPPSLPAFHGPARDRLDQILAFAGLGGFLLVPGPDAFTPCQDRTRWLLVPAEIHPTDEWVGNRTPLPPKPSAPELRGPPRPSPPIPWEEYVRWRAEHPR